MIGLNIGSGQRRFETTPEVTWTNVDCVSREGQVPDVVDDARSLATFPADYADVVVLHHVLEHFTLPDAEKVISACYRVLRLGGGLIIALPSMRALCQSWLMGKISDYIFFVNTYGAYQSEEGDIHKWAYTQESLNCLLAGTGRTWQPLVRLTYDSPYAKLVVRDWWTQEWATNKI